MKHETDVQRKRSLATLIAGAFFLAVGALEYVIVVNPCMGVPYMVCTPTDLYTSWLFLIGLGTVLIFLGANFYPKKGPTIQAT